jgi:hypothetical protein
MVGYSLMFVSSEDRSGNVHWPEVAMRGRDW